ncbi:PAS-domain containing protein [Methyloraptor flagellatus]|uniref:PAS-domain containing protein n=1 Tax=Methyloraptor flagellatus TaxID=3162530 RepID=A0AAU7XEX8_9HYPH
MSARRFGLSVRLPLVALAATLAGIAMAFASAALPWSGSRDHSLTQTVALDVVAIRAEMARHGWPLPRSASTTLDRLVIEMEDAVRGRSLPAEAGNAVLRLRNALSEEEARTALDRAEEVLGAEVTSAQAARPATLDGWIPALGGLLVGVAATAAWLLERRSHRRTLQTLSDLDARYLRLRPEFAALERTSMRLDAANRELGIENQRLREREATLALRNTLAVDAMEAMHEGLATFDATGRMVLSNRRFAAMYRLPKALAAQGTSARTLLRHWLRSGIFAARGASDAPRLVARGTAAAGPTSSGSPTAGSWRSTSNGRPMVGGSQPMRM